MAIVNCIVTMYPTLLVKELRWLWRFTFRCLVLGLSNYVCQIMSVKLCLSNYVCQIMSVKYVFLIGNNIYAFIVKLLEYIYIFL